MNNDSNLIIDRLRAKIAANSPSDPMIKAGLTRIAMLIISKAKLNVRRHRMIDSGRLLNSLRWEFYRQKESTGIYIGSFNTIYAAMNEFGGEISERQRRAMFAALSKRRVKRPSKGVLQRGARYWKPRPYLRPAIEDSQTEILQIIKAMIGRQK